MIGSKVTSPSKLTKNRSKDERVVYRLTKTAIMKFRPQVAAQEPTSTGFIDRIRSLSRLIPFGGGSRQTQSVRSSSKEKESADGSSKTTAFQTLKFLFLLDHESYLIGNKNQLDALSISLVEDYIETEHLWTIRPKSAVLHLMVDSKRRSIVVIVAGEIQLYGYETRRSKNPPQLLKSFKILDPVKMIQLAKDSLLAVFFDNYASFYTLDGQASRQFSKREYKVEKPLTLYRAAQCVEGILNVFFETAKTTGEKPMVCLYCLPLELTGTGCEVGQVKSVYEVEERFRDILRVQSINKDCFLLNLGKELILFKKGYCVDRASINYQVDNTFLKYFPDRKLVHVSPSQIDFYNLVIDLAANPPKLSLKSTDSIVTSERKGKYAFLDVLRFEEHKMGVFYQIPVANVTGQVKYQFALTMRWDFDEKVNSLLPKVSEFKGERQSENAQFQQFMHLIEQRCDSVGKMGMSRKQAYLHIWRQSGKEKVEEFKLLLDTLDYNTIREQISLKLKKRMMQWVEVHKMEQGCLGMLSESLFSQNGYTVDGFKNYLISHLLVRKLELFKEMKLYQKGAGKIRQTDLAREGDKLMINIQEYTNAIHMDIRTQLIEMVYNLCKNRKDLVTEIRIIIKRFRFPLRHIYNSLLKEVAAAVKEELLFLLQSIPEILPLSVAEEEGQAGVWGVLKEEEWDRGLHLGQVSTVFNREMVMEFSNNVWIKRNWLSYHDMIFLTREDIEKQFVNTEEGVFYGLLENVFEHYKQEDKLLELLNHLQDHYVSFPPHLYNNVFLYRKLFLYFTDNKFMNESFLEFLRRKDEEIFKRIFDHEKHKKSSLLKQVKPIYESLGQGDKFNYGLLKFFSSGLSQVSDIKYLLNRINNQKRQFHAENEEMYEVLIKGMQIKLKLGSDRDIPIEEVLIYITKIPLKEGNLLTKDLQVLKQINNLASKFCEMKINMSVFEMIRNRNSVLMCALSHEVVQASVPARPAEIIDLSNNILKILGEIRVNIYGPYSDNENLFIYLVILLQTIELLPHVRNIIEQQAAITGLPFSEGQLEGVVYYCYRKKTSENPRYAESEEYLTQLVQLLAEDNALRVFVESEIALARMFATAGLDMIYPISGSTGLISKNQLEGLIDSLPVDGLLGLDLPRGHELAAKMQKSLGVTLPPLSLYQLYEKSVRCLLRKGKMREALEQIEQMYALEGSNPSNIIYPLLVYRSFSGEFIEENKQLMLTLIAALFTNPHELLGVFRELTSQSFSNDGQREYLQGKIAGCLTADRFNAKNILFDDTVKKYLEEKPQKLEEVTRLLHQQFGHFMHSTPEFMKSNDLPIFNMFILQSPELFVKYLQRNKTLINLREVRCFLSYLSKYEIFDSFRVLEYGKRLFKILYSSESDGTDIDALITECFTAPLSELQNLPVPAPPANNENLAKLARSIDKFKAKLKAKLSTSAIQKKKMANSGIIQTVESKYTRIDEYLSDFSKYFTTPEYPFNDSDFQIQRQEVMIPSTYLQPSPKPVDFSFQKYLCWMFRRTNQPIEYYLVKANEAEVEEELKRQEEALKLSFRQAPSTIRHFKDAAPVVLAVVEKGAKEMGIEGMASITHLSAIPVAAQSTLIINPVQVEQIEEIFMGSTLLKDQILATFERSKEGKTSFRSELMKNYGAGQQTEQIWPQLLREIYKDENLEYSTALMLLGEIQSCFPKLTHLNTDFLQIYNKIDQLQKKLDLKIPTRQILPFEGLQVKEKDPMSLFAFLKESICGQLNESNVHTLSRVISLAFKKPELQQELGNEFLKAAIREFGVMELNALDESLKLQKIGAFARKMQLGQLKGGIEKIVEELEGEKRNKIVLLIAEILRHKNDGKGAQLLEQRWLNPEVKNEA